MSYLNNDDIVLSNIDAKNFLTELFNNNDTNNTNNLTNEFKNIGIEETSDGYIYHVPEIKLENGEKKNE